MGKRGPPKQPTAIRALHGNPSDKAMPVDEPEGVGDLWAPPIWFDDEQREQWHYAVDHAPPGFLTGTDLSVMNKQALLMLKSGGEMGFSPSARASLGSRAPEFPHDAPTGGRRQIRGGLDAYLDEKPDSLN